MRRLAFSRGARSLARSLLGDTLVVQLGATRCSGRIIETEAYLGPHDAASHSKRGSASAAATMFAGGGHLYVYRIYGVHHCLNVVAGDHGSGAAVLIRAIEPIDGLGLMRRRRRCPEGDLCRGPGRLCAALGVHKAHDGIDLRTSSSIWIEPGKSPKHVVTSQRIGLGRSVAGQWRTATLRFCDASAKGLSRPASQQGT
ncbi:MAG: DNA-3-methyladenine glycosylase [Phycisphaerales bacterium]|nr:DNA-3-methyladenine glycosylase [Phycisphaerales bacterium]